MTIKIKAYTLNKKKSILNSNLKVRDSVVLRKIPLDGVKQAKEMLFKTVDIGERH